jgi:hypothetical protein
VLILYIVTVSDQGTWYADVLFFLCVYCIGVWGAQDSGSEGASIMQMGQSGYSMGLEWTWIHSCASKATITSKGFIHKIKVNPNTLICCALKLTLCILLHCRPNVRLFSGLSEQLWTITTMIWVYKHLYVAQWSLPEIFTCVLFIYLLRSINSIHGKQILPLKYVQLWHPFPSLTFKNLLAFYDIWHSLF